MKHSLILAVLVLSVGTVIPGFSQTNPRFTSITPGVEGSVTLTLTGAVLTTYTILAATDLQTPFSALGVLVTDANGTGSFTDAGTLAVNRQRFYRAQQVVTDSSRLKSLGASAPQTATQANQKPQTVVAPQQTPR